MEITEVRIKLIDEQNERVRAFCSITWDNCFVVRDIKVIDSANGLFVAMPSRKITARCPHCRCKNNLRANYCNQCGGKLDFSAVETDDYHRPKLYADIAHPINMTCREMVHDRILKAFNEELELSLQSGYVSTYDDFGDSGEEGTGSEFVPAGPHFAKSRQPVKAGFGEGIFE
jgi:stage V sporulation protein G